MNGRFSQDDWIDNNAWNSKSELAYEDMIQLARALSLPEGEAIKRSKNPLDDGVQFSYRIGDKNHQMLCRTTKQVAMLPQRIYEDRVSHYSSPIIALLAILAAGLSIYLAYQVLTHAWPAYENHRERQVIVRTALSICANSLMEKEHVNPTDILRTCREQVRSKSQSIAVLQQAIKIVRATTSATCLKKQLAEHGDEYRAAEYCADLNDPIGMRETIGSVVVKTGIVIISLVVGIAAFLGGLILVTKTLDGVYFYFFPGPGIRYLRQPPRLVD